jgi:hypothetical protein
MIKGFHLLEYLVQCSNTERRGLIVVAWFSEFIADRENKQEGVLMFTVQSQPKAQI